MQFDQTKKPRTSRLWLDRALADLQSALTAQAGGCAIELLPEAGVPADLRPHDVAVLAGPEPDVQPEAVRACSQRARAFARAGLRRLVFTSSREVYGESHHLPGMVEEDQLPPGPGLSAVADHWNSLETLVREAAGGVELVVLRLATVMHPEGGGREARRWQRPIVPRAAGYDPMFQLLAPQDLAGAILAAASGVAVGCFNVAPRRAAQSRGALASVGARGLPLPWFAGIKNSCTISGRCFERTFDWSSQMDTVEALAQARGVEPREVRDDEDFGFDEEYIERKGRHFLEFLHRRYWRVEVAGMEHVPRDGPVVLTAIHRGFMPFDGVLLVHLFASRHTRVPRFLVHPSLVKLRLLAPFIQKLGGVIASSRNADRVLSAGGMVGIFPEGIRGAFTSYRQAYRIGRFGRDEFVRIALRNRAPIVPCVTVGSAEIFPIIGKVNWSWVKRLTEWPCLPITPTFPLLPIPLPSKWHTLFLPPLHVEREHPPEAAEDRDLVREISNDVKARLQTAMDDVRRRRPGVFHGNVFAGKPLFSPGESIPEEVS